jgi:uncharacterized integral membrane protein
MVAQQEVKLMSTPQQTIHWQERTDVGRIARGVIVVLIVAAIMALAIDNRHDIQLGYVIGDATAPAWMVVTASAIAGVGIGWLVKHRPGRPR